MIELNNDQVNEIYDAFIYYNIKNNIDNLTSHYNPSSDHFVNFLNYLEKEIEWFNYQITPIIMNIIQPFIMDNNKVNVKLSYDDIKSIESCYMIIPKITK